MLIVITAGKWKLLEFNFSWYPDAVKDTTSEHRCNIPSHMPFILVRTITLSSVQFWNTLHRLLHLLNTFLLCGYRPATSYSNVTYLTTVPDKTDYLKPQLDRKYTYAEVIPVSTNWSFLGYCGPVTLSQLNLPHRVAGDNTGKIHIHCPNRLEEGWGKTLLDWYVAFDLHAILFWCERSSNSFKAV